MSMDEKPGAQDLDEKDEAIQFTARLNAYYRAEEAREVNPLIIDPFAERLAGDMSEYFKRHKRYTGMGGSQIARSYYIENNLLEPWCTTHERSQIILLGAGFDTRAYRLSYLQKGFHRIFELDFPIIINHKEHILREEQPLCDLVRISSDLSRPDWMERIKEQGFSHSLPTFWILEGVVYYLDRTVVEQLLQSLSEMSADESQLFVDICVPALADLRWGPFTDNFRWGISMENAPAFFASSGWRVSCSYLDDYSHGKDVGQKGIILVHGIPDQSGVDRPRTLSTEEGPKLSQSALREFSSALMRKVLPEVEEITNICAVDSNQGLALYIDFIKSTQRDLQVIAWAQVQPALLGRISPRLLSDPLSIERDTRSRSKEEVLSYIAGHLIAALQLVYCGVKGLDPSQYKEVPFYEDGLRVSITRDFDLLRKLITIMRDEFDV